MQSCGAIPRQLPPPPVPDETTVALSTAIIDIAQARRRFGYLRIHDLLRPEFPNVNHKRHYRLYCVVKLAVEKRKKAKRPASERVPLQIAQTINEVWSMDSVSNSLLDSTGRCITCLTVVDDFSHECVDVATDFGISGNYVTRLLDQAATFRGYPSAVRTDNGPKFTSRVFMAWASAIFWFKRADRCKMATSRASTANSGMGTRMSIGSRPYPNPERLSRAWRKDYNEVRPHSSCRRMPPM
jgi:putative transposase